MSHSNQFDVPIVLFLYKRSDTVIRIINVLRSIQPSRLFLIGDGPRLNEDAKTVYNARATIERNIDWPCLIEKNYADENRGVFENIAGGVKWVFSKVDSAIFLEDDNLPAQTFFQFCKEMLERYRDDERIFWICGTNYLNRYESPNGSSYVFTKHLMPCGWASWANKFNEYYDSNFQLLNDRQALRTARRSYQVKALYRQQIRSARSEIYKKKKTGRYDSWDFQLPLTIRANELYGISPCVNQIVNIGVDEHSAHGGTSLSKEMTRRFCSIVSAPLSFPLVHPTEVAIDVEYERRVGNIILAPFAFRVKIVVAKAIKRLFGIPEFEKFRKENMRWFR